MKMPAARANAADASLPTLVDAGRVCLRMRRTHASGGSKSTADVAGRGWLLLSAVAVAVAVDADADADADAVAAPCGGDLLLALLGLPVGALLAVLILLLLLLLPTAAAGAATATAAEEEAPGVSAAADAAGGAAEGEEVVVDELMMVFGAEADPILDHACRSNSRSEVCSYSTIYTDGSTVPCFCSFQGARGKQTPGFYA